MSSSDAPSREAVRLFVRELFREHPLLRLYAIGKREFRGYLHQAELFYRLALRRPIRALIADEVGLGKTVEALLVMDWAINRGLVSRVLILTPRSLATQWEAELLRAGITPIKDPLTLDRGVFLFKIDTAKKPPLREKVLEKKWDMVIVDEAHKLGLGTERFEFVKELLKRNPESSILFLTATPHRGNSEDYIKRLILVDPGLKESMWKQLDSSEFYAKTIDSIVFRRSKHHVNELYEKDRVFVKATFRACVVKPSPLERLYIESLDKLTRDILARYSGKRGLELVVAIIDKRGLSSPEAGLLTFERVLKSLSGTNGKSVDLEEELEAYLSEEDADTDPDMLVDQVSKYSYIFKQFSSEIKYLTDLAKKILEGEDSKLTTLVSLISGHIKRGDKVVVFSEYADTANYIYRKLKNSLHAVELKLVTGELLSSNRESIDGVKEWLAKPGPRVLISTDVASEGLNLQQANVVIHYELPWSLVKLEQRVGRVWRLGQEKDVHAYALLMEVGFERAVFEVVYVKLLNLIRAHIQPSLALEEASLSCGSEAWEAESRAPDDIDVASVMGSASDKLKPFEMWRAYKTKDRGGLKELIESYIKALDDIREAYRRTFQVGVGGRRVVLEEVLRHSVGFSSRKEFEEFINSIAKSLGVSTEIYTPTTSRGYERVIIELLNLVQRKTHSQSLELLCDGYSGELYLYKVCTSVSKLDGPCWLLGYRNGSILDLRSIARELETVSSLDCSAQTIVDESSVQQGVPRIRDYVRTNVLVKLLSGYVSYLEYSQRKGLRAGVLSLPADLERDIEIVVKPLVVVRNMISRDLIAGFVGRYTEEKLELENLAIEILKKVLSGTHTVTDVRDHIYRFDLLIKDNRTGLTKLVELKTMKELKLVVYTEKEREFGEQLEYEGQEYWLYVVDLAQNSIRGYRHPLTSKKLKLVREINVGEAKYYVYRELGRPDLEIAIK
ncbi:MAG: helicase-related protein [Sulfolobales archaeon]